MAMILNAGRTEKNGTKINYHAGNVFQIVLDALNDLKKMAYLTSERRRELKSIRKLLTK
jgi:hypothetical protein